MTKKNPYQETFKTVGTALIKVWESYKRTAPRRHEDPWVSFWRDILGTEVTDADAAKYLAKDFVEIRNTLRKKKTDKEFDRIIKNINR